MDLKWTYRRTSQLAEMRWCWPVVSRPALQETGNWERSFAEDQACHDLFCGMQDLSDLSKSSDASGTNSPVPIPSLSIKLRFAYYSVSCLSLFLLGCSVWLFEIGFLCVKPWLSWNWIHRPSWPWTHKDIPTPASQSAGVKDVNYHT